MSLAAKCTESLAQRSVIRLTPKGSDDHYYHGIVILHRRALVGLRALRELEFDGIVVLPKREIRGCRAGKVEECATRIVRMLSNSDAYVPPAWLADCWSLRDVVSCLHEREIWPVVECAAVDSTGNSLYLGPIIEVGRQRFTVHCYDAEGRWEAPYEIDYADVVKIEIDDSYSRPFNQYMQMTNPRPDFGATPSGGRRTKKSGP